MDTRDGQVIPFSSNAAALEDKILALIGLPEGRSRT